MLNNQMVCQILCWNLFWEILGWWPNRRMLIFFRGLAHHRQYLDPGHGSDPVWPCLGSLDQNNHLPFVETVDNKRRSHILVSRKSLSTGSRDSQLFFFCLRCSGCTIFSLPSSGLPMNQWNRMWPNQRPPRESCKPPVLWWIQSWWGTSREVGPRWWFQVTFFQDEFQIPFWLIKFH